MILLTMLASFLLVGRGVDPIIAIVLGFMLASIAFVVISLPVRIFLVLRAGRIEISA